MEEPDNPIDENSFFKEVASAIAADDQGKMDELLEMTRSISNADLKANLLNGLLLTPGHMSHQYVAFAIHGLKHPSSVAAIRKVLESNFSFLEYTCSEDVVIAKWFSHALASIGTIEAIELIREFAQSANLGIAEEMSYRLSKISKRHKDIDGC